MKAPPGYLELAARIVDEAAAAWFLPDGTYCDPYETGDRWAGGCTARFVCPAAILVNRQGRRDLLSSAAQQMDRLCDLLADGREQPGAGLPEGVLDLVAKELQVAFRELRPHVAPEQAQRWQTSLAGPAPETAYTGSAKLQMGRRPTNYEVYASVGEWFRYQHGQRPDTEWLETMLGVSLPLFTDQGMYRDPGDPMAYDLSVRQNVAELLHAGYAGRWRERLDGLLGTAGLTTLQMLSPLGYAPYGGRSNHFVHNEAMLAYICEYEARRWRSRDPKRAGQFRMAARQARAVIAEFISLDPPRNLKNRFLPATKFGRDTGYGEYGVYSLLAASLLARTALMADESIAPVAIWPNRDADLLYLEPAFHRLFACVGDTAIELDVQGQPGHDPTGVGRFHRLGIPAPLGGSLGIAAAPKYLIGDCAADRNAAIGPGWRESGGSWHWLADSAEHVTEVRLLAQRKEPGRVEWDLQHVLGGPCPTTLRQSFTLTPGRLAIRAAVTPPAQELAFLVPCLHADGQDKADLCWSQAGAQVRFQDARLAIRVPQACAATHDPTPRASREAVYQLLEFALPTGDGMLELELVSD